MTLFSTILANAQTKEHMVETRGFEWYYVRNNNRSGAESVTGQTLIPCEYDLIRFSSDHFLALKNGKSGVFNILGKCIIPADRGYKYITRTNDKVRSIQSRFRKPEDQMGTFYDCCDDKNFIVCDINGREVLSVPMKNKDELASLESRYGRFYFRIRTSSRDITKLLEEKKEDQFEGLWDTKGKTILETKYKKIELKEDGIYADGEKVLPLSAISTTENPLNGNPLE